MSDDEMEKFEITDYDLENEFNINRNRGKRVSKHHQIYGIWADDSDNEEDNHKPYKSRRQPKNYSDPIGFVAGGVQQAGKKDKEKDNDVKEEDESDEEKPSFGPKDSSEESEDETPRAGFGAKNAPKSTQSTKTEITGDIAGLRRKNTTNPSLMNKGVGHWEKHTKGIGAKLLLQMGFQPGKGLGKDLQGIQAPVEAHLRKGRGAIGAYGPEKAATIAKIEETSVKTEDDESNKRTESGKWKKTELQKKTRYYYRSVDDVIEKGKRPGAYRNLGTTSDLSKVKVIDMTGPQQRVLSGYHALSGLKAPPGVEHFEDVVHKKCSNFALPEIQHNLDLLVDMCEQDIIRIDRNTRTCEDKLVALEQEEITLKESVKKESGVCRNLKFLLEVVDKLMDPSQGFSLVEIQDTFKNLKEDFAEEYYTYEIGELAPALIGPLLTSAMANWNPLTKPDQFKAVFEQWKEILEVPKDRGILEGNKMGIQPYDSLIWHTWMPVMRTCVRDDMPREQSIVPCTTPKLPKKKKKRGKFRRGFSAPDAMDDKENSNWDCRDLDYPLNKVMDVWIPILPDWIVENIYDQLIIPRLLKEVNDWNPLTDTLPIHLWIHQWIPLLDSRLQATIYPVIMEKLGAALANWHPSDGSAKLMLIPWQRALSPGAFVAFLLKHIVPKLQICMQSLAINPHQQLLEPWNWVMDWSEMLSVANMTLILDKFFFPRWLQTLALWLNHNPNYNQVTEWYTGWKRMLSEELYNQPTIKDNFHKALEMMNRSVELGQQPGAKESISYLKNMEADGYTPPTPQVSRVESIAEAAKTAAQIPQGFKDLVTKRCEERGILFVPVPNKYREAKQVYRIGNNGVQCYIDRNVIFYTQNNSQWTPTSLNKLLEIAS